MNELRAVYFSSENIPLALLQQLTMELYGKENTTTSINYKYFLTCLLLLKNDKPVATACLYKNSMIEDGTTLLFGNLECVNDPIVFDRLMQEIENYSTNQYFTQIIGPMNGSTWDEYRLPTSHFGRQFITDLPQPKYYADYLQNAGFEVYQQYFTHQSLLEGKETDKTLVKYLQKEGIAIRNISLNNYEEELKKLHLFCSEMFAENVLFTPIEQADFIKKYNDVKPFIHPDCVLIAEDSKGAIQGFIFCIPDTFQQSRLVMKTIARNIHQNRWQGLMTYMIDELHNKAYANGFQYLIHAFMHGNNRSRLLSEKYEGRPLKSYGLFRKVMQLK